MAEKFIQKIAKKTEKKGTDCPKDSIRYNLAVILRRLAHEKDMRIKSKKEKD